MDAAADIEKDEGEAERRAQERHRDEERSPSPDAETGKSEMCQKDDLATEGSLNVFNLPLEVLEKCLPSELTAVPEYTVSSSVQETFQKFCDVHAKGRRLNDDIRRNKRISNPYFVANTLQRYGIDQGASEIESCKRRRMVQNAETDSIQAFRQFKKQHKQAASQIDSREEASRKQRPGEGGHATASHMTAMQQEAISQFVMEANRRLRPFKEPGRK